MDISTSEIIDLTESSPPKATATPITISSDREEDEEAGADTPTRGERKRRRRKKTKRPAADMEDGEVADDSPAPSAKRREVLDGGRKVKDEVIDLEDSTGSSKASRAEAKERNRTRRKRRASSPDDGRREPSPPRLDDTSGLFFVDIKPTDVAVVPDEAAPAIFTGEVNGQHKPDEDSALLLPAHVVILPTANGSVLPVEILPPSEPASDEDEYIEYLDHGDRKAPGTVRYFDEEPEHTKPTRTVCKKCGAENDHKTYECTVLICLTCGARDEHLTRSCPISKTCFSCGMKGHISQACPTRRTGRHGRVDDQYDCDRCGSSSHRTLECPTLWRMYEYVDTDQRVLILAAREEKSQLGIGSGGEGYIATDQWCYNCGENGHLGDDCTSPNQAPSAPSAFGAYNTHTGPFAEADPAAPPPRRGPRDWEAADTVPDGWGFNAPANVGQQGRRKDRARMEQRARAAAQDEDDPDDWFGNPRNARGRGMGPPPAPGGSSGRNGGGGGGGGGDTKGKMSFGSLRRPSANGADLPDRPVEDDRHRSNDRSRHSNRNRHAPPEQDRLEIRGAAKRSLVDRISDAFQTRDDHHGGRRDRGRERDRDHGRDRDWHRDQDQDRHRDHDGNHDRYGGREKAKEMEKGRTRRREDNRPRYGGGYPTR